MIRINLIKDKKTKTAQFSALDNIQAQLETDTNIDIPAFLFRILLLILLPMCFYMYEFYNKDGLEKKLGAISQRISSIKIELKEKEVSSKKTKKTKDLIRGLEVRLALIERLSKTRLFEIKALDELQSIVPDNLWIEYLEYNLEKGSFEVQGKASSKGDYDTFLNRLKRSSYFTDNVTLKSATGSRFGKKVLEFRMTSKLVLGDR